MKRNMFSMAAGLLKENSLMSDFRLINQHSHMETHDAYL